MLSLKMKKSMTLVAAALGMAAGTAPAWAQQQAWEGSAETSLSTTDQARMQDQQQMAPGQDMGTPSSEPAVSQSPYQPSYADPASPTAPAQVQTWSAPMMVPSDDGPKTREEVRSEIPQGGFHGTVLGEGEASMAPTPPSDAPPSTVSRDEVTSQLRSSDRGQIVALSGDATRDPVVMDDIEILAQAEQPVQVASADVYVVQNADGSTTEYWYYR